MRGFIFGLIAIPSGLAVGGLMLGLPVRQLFFNMIPVLVLCQLNRELESRQDKHPQLSDLRDTGALEQDADGVIFLYREDYYADPGTVDPNVPSMLEVNLAKNRHGSVGRCNIAFSMASSRVTALANRPTKAQEGPEQMTLRKWRQPYGKRTAAGAD